jgi:hypothetical protein
MSLHVWESVFSENYGDDDESLRFSVYLSKSTYQEVDTFLAAFLQSLKWTSRSFGLHQNGRGRGACFFCDPLVKRHTSFGMFGSLSFENMLAML